LETLDFEENVSFSSSMSLSIYIDIKSFSILNLLDAFFFIVFLLVFVFMLITDFSVSQPLHGVIGIEVGGGKSSYLLFYKPAKLN
jgi:Flp pilus assembly protein protease CpaA